MAAAEDDPSSVTASIGGRWRNRTPHRNARYDAFVSYSHQQDKVLADALQSELQAFARPWYRPRALRIFRDETNLSATPGLWPTIQRALEVSDWFVLMASPVSAGSPWVQREIEWWVEHRQADRILLALTDGEIRWSGHDFDWTVTNAVPTQLSRAFTHEPFWIDLSKLRSMAMPERGRTDTRPRLGDVVAEFAAPIRGQDKDTLVGEHIRYQRRTRRLVQTVIASLTSLLLAAVVAAVVAVVQANNANIQRRAALLQRDIATSRQLAANAELAAGTDPQLAALLSSAAFVVHDTPEARTSMLHQLGNQARRHAHSERFLSAHAGPVGSISFSGDGRTLAAGGDKVVLWDWAAGGQLATLPGRADRLVFSPRGDTLAVTDGDKVTLWDVARRVELASFPARAGRTPIAFSPDGSRLAVGGIGFTTIVVWDIVRKAKVASLTLPPSPAAPPEGLGNTALAFSPDGALLVADANYQGVVIWDVARATLITSLKGGLPCLPLSLAFSPDHRTVAAGCAGHTAMIMLWNQRLGTELARLQADGDVDSLAFSTDGLTLASGDAAGHVALWDMAKLTRIDTLTSHTAEVSSVAFSPDGTTLASSSYDTNVIIWKLGSRNALDSVNLPGAGIPVAFNPAGKLLAVQSGKDGTGTAVWDVDRRIQVASLTEAGTPVGFVAERRVLVTRDGTFAVWDIGSGQRLTALNVPAAAVGAGHGPYAARPVALSRDGRVFATVIGDGKTLVVWDIGRDAQVASLPAPKGVSSLAFGPDARTLAVGESGPIVVWDVRGAKKIAEFTVDTRGGSIVTIALSANGHNLASLQPAGQPQTASGCFGCDVILWDVDRRTQIATLSGHSVQPDSVTFSPDNQILVSTGGSESIIWSIPQRASMVTLKAATGPAIFSPRGHTLATASINGAIALWDTDPASWRRKLCTIAGRDLTTSEWSAYLPETPYRPVCST